MKPEDISTPDNQFAMLSFKRDFEWIDRYVMTINRISLASFLGYSGATTQFLSRHMKRQTIVSSRHLVCMLLGLGLIISNAATRYVVLGNTQSLSPYTRWATASSDIQSALNVCKAGDQVIVDDGIYQTGAKLAANGALSNRVVVPNFVWVRSRNGADFTVIRGAADPVSTNGPAAVRCVYLGQGSSLTGFTLREGHTQSANDINFDQSGGAAYAWGATLKDCIIERNRAGFYGGGVYGGVLTNCAILFNTAVHAGGGAANCSLTNCTLIGNVAIEGSYAGIWPGGTGGGAAGGILSGCIITSNRCGYAGGGAYGSTLSNCIIRSNFSDIYGGGSSSSTLIHCIVSNNVSLSGGGGVYQGSLTNCLIIDNGSNTGGGASEANLENCTVFRNRADHTGGVVGGKARNSIIYYNASSGLASECDLLLTESVFVCSPQAKNAGCITNAPLFVNTNLGDVHLLAESPCRNAGTNLDWMTGAVDLDKNVRINEGKVDMGAFEFAGGGSSAQVLLSIALKSPARSGVILSWPSAAGKTYRIERCSGLAPKPIGWTALASDLAATPPMNIYTDYQANATAPKRFYRLAIP